MDTIVSVKKVNTICNPEHQRSSLFCVCLLAWQSTQMSLLHYHCDEHTFTTKTIVPTPAYLPCFLWTTVILVYCHMLFVYVLKSMINFMERFAKVRVHGVDFSLNIQMLGRWNQCKNNMITAELFVKNSSSTGRILSWNMRSNLYNRTAIQTIRIPIIDRIMRSVDNS